MSTLAEDEVAPPDLEGKDEKRRLAAIRARRAYQASPAAAAAEKARASAHKAAVKRVAVESAEAAAAPVLSVAAAKKLAAALLRAAAPSRGAMSSPAGAAAIAASSAYIASKTPDVGSRKPMIRYIENVDGLDPRDGLFWLTLDDGKRVVVPPSFFDKKAKILDSDFLRLDAPVMFEQVSGGMRAKGEVKTYFELRAVFTPSEEAEWAAAGFL